MSEERPSLTGIMLGIIQQFMRNQTPVDQVFGTLTNDGRKHVVAVRDGYELKDLPSREHAAPAHRFVDVSDFAAWVKARALHLDHVDILVDAELVAARLQVGDPDSALVQCRLKVHPRLERWALVIGRPIDQRGLLLLLNAAAEDVHGGENVLGMLVGELSKLEVASGGDLKVQLDPRTGMQIFAGATKTNTVNGKLPSEITICVPVYSGAGLDPDQPDGEKALITFALEIELVGTPPIPQFTLRWSARDDDMLQARRRVRGVLRQALGPLPCIGLGDLQERRVVNAYRGGEGPRTSEPTWSELMACKRGPAETGIAVPYDPDLGHAEVTPPVAESDTQAA